MYYQLSIIWVKNPIVFQNYQQQLYQLLKEHNIQVSMVFQPLSIWLMDIKSLHPVLKKHSPITGKWYNQTDIAININTPSLITLFSYPNKNTYQEFAKNKAYKALLNLKREALDEIAYSGDAKLYNSFTSNSNKTIYNIELANYKNRNKELYLNYETIAEPTMMNYGYQKTCFLTIDKKWTAKNPCFIKISSFKDAERIMQYEQSISQTHHNLYAKAIENLIWITAKALA